MTHMLKNPVKRAGIALAALAAVAALGSGPAHAQQFVSASISTDRLGNLECLSRQTGLTPGGVVRYDCSSQYVGVLQQCMLSRKTVGNPKLLIFQNIHPHEVENFEVPRNGQVRAAIVTQVPESENANLICTAPSELTTTAVRWCNNSLVDLTHNIVGANVAELFSQLVVNASGSVPSCAVLAQGPFTTPGE